MIYWQKSRDFSIFSVWWEWHIKVATIWREFFFSGKFCTQKWNFCWFFSWFKQLRCCVATFLRPRDWWMERNCSANDCWLQSRASDFLFKICQFWTKQTHFGDIEWGWHGKTHFFPFKIKFDLVATRRLILLFFGVCIRLHYKTQI